jgi:hypothetical protein
MKKLIKYLFILALVIGFAACQEEYEVGDAGAKTLSGDWVVIEYNLDVEALYGPYTLQVYNTSFDPDMIWIENIYDSGYKVKANKLSDTTFGVTGATDVTGGHDGTMDIVDGEVFDNDSISFRVILYDADGEIADDYLEAGHRYTGWADDQH